MCSYIGGLVREMMEQRLFWVYGVGDAGHPVGIHHFVAVSTDSVRILCASHGASDEQKL
jgi:hypothetical protein